MKLSFGIKLEKNLDHFLLYRNIESIFFFRTPSELSSGSFTESRD